MVSLRVPSAILFAALCRLGLSLPHDPPAEEAKRPPPSGQTPLLVDLGYGLYNGSFVGSTGLNVWKGIRFAAPPVGALRWQKPQAPATNRTVVQATAVGPNCPWAFPAVPGVPFTPGNEDCLFLNVYAPADRTGGHRHKRTSCTDTDLLPVLVWIHGGGYGLGDGTQDLSAIINANENGFIGVSIQYRLGAFGFLSSAEVKAKGVLNTGILDQAFALSWVQKHISKFGGDPKRVTISGESAGGGSVMLHAMAEGGTQGTKLFQNGIAASPYDPGQNKYDDKIPTDHYISFAKRAGCEGAKVFECLVGKDSTTLQWANHNESLTAPFGNWAFLPVTDGTYITDLPSTQLGKKKINGKRLLVANNANEGSIFVPPTIVTQDDLLAWLATNFPNLTPADLQAILAANPSSSAPTDPNAPRQETSGIGPPYALNVSQAATGQQQRAFNIYAEATFVCPAYWLADAYTGAGKKAFYYQYSVPFASHGADVTGYFGPGTSNQGPDLQLAFKKIWGNFIVNGDPSVSNPIANGARAISPNAPNPASTWPVWSERSPMLINLNQTGGVLTPSPAPPTLEYLDPGLLNLFTQADAFTWELNRGGRCKFWQALGPKVPQ